MILSKLERRCRHVSFDSLTVYDVLPHDCDLEDFKRFYQAKSGKKIETEQLKTLELVRTENDNDHVVNAHVPQGEIFKYATDLRSMTHGEGSFRMKFSHYEEVPAHISQKIVEEYEQSKQQK